MHPTLTVSPCDTHPTESHSKVFLKVGSSGISCGEKTLLETRSGDTRIFIQKCIYVNAVVEITYIYVNTVNTILKFNSGLLYINFGTMLVNTVVAIKYIYLNTVLKYNTR